MYHMFAKKVFEYKHLNNEINRIWNMNTTIINNNKKYTDYQKINLFSQDSKITANVQMKRTFS